MALLGIIDYINAYKDCDFKTMRYNDIDGLILSQFSYLKFDTLIPEVGTNDPDVVLADLAHNPNIKKLFSDERYAKNNKRLFNAMARSKRFGTMRLNHYISLLDADDTMQFSAITCVTDDDIVRIAYRGTDETITGWKEDFNMSYEETVPSQEKALDYLYYVSNKTTGPMSLCGHSKGGNLAVYATAMCSSDVYERIYRVNNYDGPGFPKQFIESADPRRLEEKIHKLVPHSSIVGMLLNDEEDYEVVACKHFGILQHDPFNWIVTGDDFDKFKDLPNYIKIKNASINEWAENMDKNDQSKEFVNILFDVATTAQINDLNDFKIRDIKTVSKNFLEAIDEMDDEKKELMKQLFRSLIEIFISQVKTRSGISILNEWDRISKRNT